MHIDRRVRYQLGCVDDHSCPVSMGELGDARDIGNRAEDIRHSGHGDNLHVWSQFRLEDGHVETPVIGDGDMVQGGACSFGHHLPRHQVGVVLHLGSQDSISLGKILQPPAEGNSGQGCCRPTGEDDLPLVGRSDEIGDSSPGCLVGLGGRDGELVGTPVNIGVGGASEAIHRFENGYRLLRGGSRIEEMHPVVEDREVCFQV